MTSSLKVSLSLKVIVLDTTTNSAGTAYYDTLQFGAVSWKITPVGEQDVFCSRTVLRLTIITEACQPVFRQI